VTRGSKGGKNTRKVELKKSNVGGALHEEKNNLKERAGEERCSLAKETKADGEGLRNGAKQSCKSGAVLVRLQKNEGVEYAPPNLSQKRGRKIYVFDLSRREGGEEKKFGT